MDEDIEFEFKKKEYKYDYEESPLFSTNTDELKENTTAQALQTILYDDTPDEIAENFKNKGNEQLQQLAKGGKKPKRVYLKDALGFYTQGLSQKITNTKLKCDLLNNRAHVHIEMGNTGYALEDINECIKLDPQNVKAFYRGAKACLNASKWKQALHYINGGLKLNKDSKLFERMKKEAEAGLQKAIEKEKEDKKRRQMEKEMAIKIKKLLEQKGIKVGKFSGEVDTFIGMGMIEESNQSSTNPAGLQIDPETQTWYFPVIFVYDEFNQMDYIQTFPETEPLINQLDSMFPPNGPEFPYGNDEQRKQYTIDNIAVFYLDHKSINKYEYQYIQVDIKKTLGEILKEEDYTLPSTLKPIFHVVPKQSQFYKRWK